MFTCDPIPAAGLARIMPILMQDSLLTQGAHDCRGNVEDALEKLQAAVDGAVESIQPIEVDPEKQKQINKQ